MSDAADQSTRAPALYPLVGLIGGLLLARILPLPAAPLVLAALAPGWLAWRRAKTQPGQWLLFFALATCLGAWAYGGLRLPETPPDKVLQRPLREAALSLRIEQVMINRSPYDQASAIARVLAASPTSRLKAGSRIYCRINLPEDDGDFALIRGQRLGVTGLLQPLPPDTPEDSFEGYLKGLGIHYSLNRTSELREITPANPFMRFCHRMNQHFKGYLQRGHPRDSELGDIYVAMLLGEKAALSSTQKDRFRMSGTMHLFAISGLHIGVVAAVIAQALLLLRVPRAITPLIGLPLLYCYVEITGAAPSAVRAFLMVTFFWLSLALARQRNPLAATLGSAVLVLLVQPWQLWQIGFQLSYLVVFSILLFGLPFYKYLTGRCHPCIDLPPESRTDWQKSLIWLTDKGCLLFAISFSAWLISAPLGAAFFGLIAPYAVIINLLLVHLAALAITTGVLTLGCALLGAAGPAWFLNHGAWVVIGLMDHLVDWNLKLPLAVIDCPRFPTAVAHITVLLFIAAVLFSNATGRRKVALIGGPVIVFAGLAVGLVIA